MTTETLAMQTIVVDGVTKYTIAYPLTDENGQPLLDRSGKPRFTNLVADSPEELITKQAQQNIEVARALERSSKRFETLNRRPTPKAAAVDLKPKELTPDEKVQVGLDIQDPRKAADAVQRVVQSAVPVGEITTEVQRQAKNQEMETRKNIAREFISKHKDDYLAVEANNAMLNQYMIANNLEFSVANLEFAEAVLRPSLAQRPKQNAPAAAPPDNAPPDNAPPNRDTPPPDRRAPASGIRNSQASGLPASSATVLTRAQALEMLYKNRAQYEAWMRDPVKNKILNAALAGR